MKMKRKFTAGCHLVKFKKKFNAKITSDEKLPFCLLIFFNLKYLKH